MERVLGNGGGNGGSEGGCVEISIVAPIVGTLAHRNETSPKISSQLGEVGGRDGSSELGELGDVGGRNGSSELGEVGAGGR